MDIFQYQDYKEFLKERFNQRRSRDDTYSLRRFAGDIGLSPSRLSEVLGGKHGLSLRKAILIADRLALSVDERKMFELLVAARSPKSVDRSRAARSQIIKLKSERQPLKIDVDYYHLIADWYHFALVELIAISRDRQDEEHLANELGISRMQVSSALGRLQKLGLLRKRNKKYEVCARDTKTTHGAIQSDAIVKAQTQIIEKAKRAVNTETIENREFGSLILAFDRQKMATAKKRIRDFRKQFNAEFAPSGREDAVYCLAMQFFSLNGRC